MSAAPSSTRRVLQSIAGVAVTGVVLYIAGPALVQVLSSWRDLATLEAGWVPVVVGCEIASFICIWVLQRIALGCPRWFVIGTSHLAGNAFTGVVPGGQAAGAALQLRMLSRAGVDTSQAAPALAAVSLITTGTLFAMPVLALPAILTGAPVASRLVDAAWLGGLLFILLASVGLALLLTRRPLEAIGYALQAIRNRVRRHEPPMTDLPQRLLADRDLVRRELGASWRRALVAAVGRSTFDYLALLGAVFAVGARPRPSAVLLAYVAASVLALLPITPGGLGIVETGLTATLALAGVPAGEAVLATLAYRLAQYWLPLVAGFVAFWLHRRAFGRVPALEPPA